MQTIVLISQSSFEDQIAYVKFLTNGSYSESVTFLYCAQLHCQQKNNIKIINF